MQLILASGSRARRVMLENAGVVFKVIPANIDESKIQSFGLPPQDLAITLARAKAEAVSRSKPEAIVIGADQVMEFAGRSLAKAASIKEARERLKEMRGREHTLISSVSLRRAGDELWSCTDKAVLKMLDFDDGFIEGYIKAAGSALLDTVGGYEVEGPGIRLFDQIRGDYFTILGMPLLPLLKRLRQEEGIYDEG